MSDLGWAGRWVAAVLAVVWIGVGATTIVLLRGRWLAIVLGIMAIAYGLMWIHVMRTAWRLDIRALRFRRRA